MEITIWRRLNEEGLNPKMNHFEEGWSEDDKPSPVKESFENQKAWKNEKWEKSHGWLINGVVEDGLRKRE